MYFISKKFKKEVVVVIGNDFSTDEWQIEIQDLLDNFYKNIKILNLSHKNVVKTRNDINRFIVEELGNVNLIGRLDSDDEFCDLEAPLKFFNELSERFLFL
jgi:hypothetical protein